MELRIRALLGIAGLGTAIVLFLFFLGGDSEDDRSRGRGTAGAAPGEAGAVLPPARSEERSEQATASEPYEPEPGSDEQKAVETIDGTYEVLRVPGARRGTGPPGKASGCNEACWRASRRIDGQAMCDLMTEEAQKQTAHYGRTTSGRAEVKTCADGVAVIARRSMALGTFGKSLNAEVVDMNVEGDRATASVTYDGRSIATLSLVKEDGEWKIPGNSPDAASR
jgi:hypothetical protein